MNTLTLRFRETMEFGIDLDSELIEARSSLRFSHSLLPILEAGEIRVLYDEFFLPSRAFARKLSHWFRECVHPIALLLTILPESMLA